MAQKSFVECGDVKRNADYLLQLMKQQIDALVAQDDHLQAFLTGEPKSCTVTVPYKPEAVRAFYLAIARTLALVSGKLDLDRVNAPPGGEPQRTLTILLLAVICSDCHYP